MALIYRILTLISLLLLPLFIGTCISFASSSASPSSSLESSGKTPKTAALSSSSSLAGRSSLSPYNVSPLFSTHLASHSGESGASSISSSDEEGASFLPSALFTPKPGLGVHGALSPDNNQKKATISSPFTVEPFQRDPLYLKEGEPGPLLRCSISPGYRNRSRYELEWLQVAEHTPIDTVATTGDYNLRLRSGVNFSRDNGRFFCSVNDLETGRQMVSQPTSVVVLVPPLAPRISAQPQEPVREGDFVTFRCDSAGGNPPPRFHWAFENGSLLPEQWHHETVDSVRGRRSQSTLQWHVRAGDHRTALACRVWNPALGGEGEHLATQTNRLNVLYSPRVRLAPVPHQPNGRPLALEFGETVELTCSADANPPPTQFHWIHVGTGEQFQGPKWTFQVQRTHAGEFQCTATNSLGSGTERLALVVQYAPIAKIISTVGMQSGTGSSSSSSFSSAEGERLQLECEIDSNPRAQGVAWTGPNGLTQNGSRLLIDSVNRHHSGTFTCTAWNALELSPIHKGDPSPRRVLRSGRASLAVDVRHRPGPAVIVAERTELLVGETLQLQCRTDGDPGLPPAQFRWALPPKLQASAEALEAAPIPIVDTSRSTLRIPEVHLQHSGLYRCAPYNDVGDGEPVAIEIQVVEKARILRALTPLKLMAGDENTHGEAKIECEADGYPEPRIHWLRDGLPITSTPSLSQSEFHQNHQPWKIPATEHSPVQSGSSCSSSSPRTTSLGSTPSRGSTSAPCPVVRVRSFLSFPGPIDWRAKGNYSCVAENTPLASPSIASTLVTVTHDPVILNPRLDSTGTDTPRALAAADLGQTAHLICTVSARPEPRVLWFRDGVEIGTDPMAGGRLRNRQLTRVPGRLDEFEAVLEIQDVGERDCGIYTCRAWNGAGRSWAGPDGRPSAELDILFQPKSAPQTPTTVRVLASGTTWIQMGCQPGFDGGHTQHFEVEWRGPVDPYTGELEPDAPVTRFTFDAQNASTTVVYGEVPSKHSSSSQSSSHSASPLLVPELLFVQNLTRLRVQSGYMARVRAVNQLGPSDWSPQGPMETADVAPDSEEKLPSMEHLSSASVEVFLPAPSSLVYSRSEHTLTVHFTKAGIQRPSSSPGTPSPNAIPPSSTDFGEDELCALISVLSASDTSSSSSTSNSGEIWRALERCVPLTSPSSTSLIVDRIRPARGYRAKVCTRDLAHCSAPTKIYVDQGSVVEQALFILALLVPTVLAVVLALSLGVFCLRRRRDLFQKKHQQKYSHKNVVLQLAGKGKGKKGGTLMAKDLQAAGVTIDRIDSNYSCSVGGPLQQQVKGGSQADSGVFTLNGSTSVVASTGEASALAIGAAANAQSCGYRRSVYALDSVRLGGAEVRESSGGVLGGNNANNSTDNSAGSIPEELQASFGHENRHLHYPMMGSYHPHLNNQLTNNIQQVQHYEPYDFSNDPFLAEFIAANEHNGIVVVENGLHSHSCSPDADGNDPSPPNTAATVRENSRYARFFESLSALIGGSGAVPGQQQQPKVSGSGVTLVGDSGSGNGSDSSTAYSPPGSGAGAPPGQQRVMREVIV